MTKNDSFNQLITFNNRIYLVIDHGGTTSSGIVHNYTLYEILNDSIHAYITYSGRTGSLYKSDNSLYWYVRYDTSSKTRYCIFYFPNGDLTTQQTIYNEEFNNVYSTTVEYLKKWIYSL